jgi:hypothetical protein
MALRCVAAVLLCLAPAAVGADAAASVQISARTTASQHSPTVPVDIVVSVTNSTAETVSLGEMTLACPVELVCDLTEPIALDQDLPAGATYEKAVRVSVASRPGWRGLGWLFFSAGTYVFRVSVDYQHADVGAKDAVSVELPVPFGAPFAVLIVGALAGSLLVGLLSTWRRLLEEWRAARLTARTIAAQAAGLAFLELPTGMLAALLAIVIAHISTEFAGVLKIELNDVWAGVIVGLLAQSTTGPVAEALRRYIPQAPGKRHGADSGTPAS